MRKWAVAYAAFYETEQKSWNKHMLQTCGENTIPAVRVFKFWYIFLGILYPISTITNDRTRIIQKVN